MSSSRAVPMLALLAVFVAAGCQHWISRPPADLVLTNAYVYTVDATRSVARALAISGKQIVFVGSVEDAAAYVGPETVVRDLAGAMVMPGIHDMHIHALGTVESDLCDLDSAALSLEEMVTFVEACLDARQIAPGDWLIVLQWGFSSGNQPSERLPNIRAALDVVSREHPIFLWGDDGHHGAANSAALALAQNADGEVVGLSAETLADEFADWRPMVAVDERGEPTGGLNEDARMIVRPHFMQDMMGVGGAPDVIMPKVAAVMAAHGITSLQDAIVDSETLAAYGWLLESGGMTFRLRAALAEPESERIEDIDAHLARLIGLRSQYEDSELIQANAVKLFADSVLEGNPLAQPPTLPVAATLGGFEQPIFGGSIDDGSFDVVGYVDLDSAPCRAVRADLDAYADSERVAHFESLHGFFPQQCIAQGGIFEHDESFIRAYIREATEAGFHVHVHALSDMAVRVAVDEFGRVKEQADRKGLTQSLAHVQLAHPDDQKRIGELGVYVVFTFVWATPDLQYEMMVAPFIDRIAGMEDLYNLDHYYMKNVYPARSIQEFGGLLVNGSDAPVGSRSPMPFVSLQQAIHRSDGEHVMNASERIDIHSAIEAFTLNGAKLFRHDEELGSIEVGKTADLIAIDRNIVELAESGRVDEIGGTQVTLTIFDGRVVFEGPSSDSVQ